MDHTEKKVLLKLHTYLLENIDFPAFAKKLLRNKVIQNDECQNVCGNNTKEERAKLLLKLYRKCSVDLLIKCLSESGQEIVSGQIEEQLGQLQCVRGRSMYSTPLAVGINQDERKTIEFFSEKVKMKIHNAEAKVCVWKFDVWSKALMKVINHGDLSLADERKYADCCFVLLDALVVLHRTHDADRSSLHIKQEFKNMESIVSKTANPTLTRIRYQGRYGVSLYQGGNYERGSQYLTMALSDAAQFMSGKDIGNILFALVNMKLEQYSQNSNKQLKDEILQHIESGIRYFENENEDIRNNWRCIYLEKKTCCHLGINSDGSMIKGATVHLSDLESAKKCLAESEELQPKMDLRRTMHYYRAKAFYHAYKRETDVASGYLKQALQLAKQGGFNHDRHLLQKQCSVGGTCLREPSENDEVGDTDESEEKSLDTPSVLSTPYNDTPLYTLCIRNISQALNIETLCDRHHYESREPSEN